MQVTVRAFAPAVERTLASVGYERRTDIPVDHRPPLADGPQSDWEKWYFHSPAEQRPTHLHVRIQGRANQQYALLFRDYLRAHPVAAHAYGIIKQQLARYHPTDWDAYYDIKDPVCDLIWSAAEDWARVTHWQPRHPARKLYGDPAAYSGIGYVSRKGRPKRACSRSLLRGQNAYCVPACRVGKSCAMRGCGG